MTRPFATIGFTMLFALCLFNNLNSEAARAVLIIALVAFCIFIAIKNTRKNGALPIAAAVVAFCCVFSAVNFENTKNKTEDYINTTVNIYGVITDLPSFNNGKVYYTVKTEKINGFDNTQKILISSKNDFNAEPLDFLEGSFSVYALGSGNAETADYYKSKGYFLGAYINDYDSVTVTSSSGFHPYSYVLKARQAIISTVETVLPNEYGSLLLGLLLGIKTSMNPKTLNAFSLVGSYHLLAVSGLHTTVWAAFVYSILKTLNVKRKKRAVACIAFTLFFMALTGFNPPVVRAGILLIFAFLSQFFKRQADSYNSIGFAITVMLIINPFAALSVSLWLSVFASIGIIYLSPRITEKIKLKKVHNKAASFIYDFVTQSVAVSVSAVLFTLPMMLISFERFSLVSPLANLLLIWISSVAMLTAGFAVLLYLVGLKFVAMPIFLFSGFVAKTITKIANALSSLQFVSLSTKNTSLCVWTAVLLIFVAAAVLVKNKNKKIIKVCSFLFVISFVAVCVFGAVNEKRTLKITAVNVGNGSCTVISQNGRAVLIGCGGNYFSSANICDILSKEGVRDVDFAFIPRENETESSALDGVEKKYDILQLKRNETGKLNLWNNVQITCENEYAFIKNEELTVLVVFTPALNVKTLPFEYQSADFLVSRAALPKNFEHGNFGKIILSSTEQKSKYEAAKASLYSTSGGSITIEVKQNGRTKVKRAA